MVGKPPPHAEAVERLEKAVRMSKRQSSVRLPVAFARGPGDEDPPLVRMMRGGQGGEAPLLVYLLLRMRGTAVPHKVKITAADAAACLDFADPAKVGARRVNAALKRLAALKLIAIEAPPGLTRTIEILHPDGSGRQWSDHSLTPPYITLPIELWLQGWLLSLSGRALALLIVLKELTGGRNSNGAWADGIRKGTYGFSDETWNRASQELQDRGLLTIKRETYSSHGEPRQRNVYQLHLDVLKDCRPYGHSADPDRPLAKKDRMRRADDPAEKRKA